MYTGGMRPVEQGSSGQDMEMNFYETKRKFGGPELSSSRHKITMTALMMGYQQLALLEDSGSFCTVR